MPSDRGAWIALGHLHKVVGLLFRVCLLLVIVIAGAKQLGLEGGSAGKGGLKLGAGVLVAGLYGWITLEFVLRVIHFAIGSGDMDLMDMVISILIIVANGVIPVGIAVGIMRLKR